MRGTMTDEPTVTIGKSSNNTTVYHTRECHRYPRHPRRITLGEAHRRGLRECKECRGESTRQNATGTPLKVELDKMNPGELGL